MSSNKSWLGGFRRKKITNYKMIVKANILEDRYWEAYRLMLSVPHTGTIYQGDNHISVTFSHDLLRYEAFELLQTFGTWCDVDYEGLDDD